MGRSWLVEEVEVSDGRLSIRPGPELRALLAADPWVEYPAEVDLASVPRSVLLQTATYLLAPLAWAHGLVTTVSGADTSVATALPRLREEMRRMYPALAWAGDVTVTDPVPPPPVPQATGVTGLMFSGGVDSVSSALRHPDGTLVLLTIDLDDEVGPPGRWTRTMAGAAAFAATHDQRHLRILTNARSMVPRSTTRALKPTVEHWWSQVAHAMSLSGLAAPALWQAGADRLLIASSYAVEYDSHWGSSGRLDPLIGLGSIRVEHDASDDDRLLKVVRIVESVGPGGSLDLRVCYKATVDDRLNCGVCEKCCRTQASVILGGGDPARFGFPDPMASALVLSEDDWISLVTPLRGGNVLYWSVMAEAARSMNVSTRPPETRAYLRWMATLMAGVPPLRDPDDVARPQQARPARPARPAVERGPRPVSWRRRLRRRLRRLLRS